MAITYFLSLNRFVVLEAVLVVPVLGQSDVSRVIEDPKKTGRVAAQRGRE